MYVVVGPTKVFVLPVLRTRALDPGPAVEVWRRDELELGGDPRGLFGKLGRQVKGTGERYAAESTGKTGGLKKMFNDVRELLANPAQREPTT